MNAPRPTPPIEEPIEEPTEAGADGVSSRNRRTLLSLTAVVATLLALPLAVSLIDPGGAGDPLVVAFLPFRAPPAEIELDRTANALLEGTHARLRDEPLPRVALVDLTETRAFRGSAAAPADLGREIGGDFVLAGALRPVSADSARLSAALIRVADGREVWTGEIDFRRSSPSERSLVLEWLSERVRRSLQAARAP